MVCIYCGSDLSVINSRAQKRTNSVWRRRKCDSCGAVITTTEGVDYAKTLVYRGHQNHIQPFIRAKLFISVYEAVKHRKDALEAAEALTDTIIAHLLPQITASGLDRAHVIRTVHEALQRFDAAAATHYQAYHP